MANKYLDLAGLEHLWDKIEAEVSTAADNAKDEAIASAATDATTKANNALSSAKTDTDNKLKSYLPLSGIATAATKLSNTTAIGSATQPVYFSADGVPVATTYTLGASVPSGAVFTDEKVKLTAVAPTSNTYYYPVMHSATTGTTSLGTNSGIKVQMVTGTTSVTGFNQLVLGNNTASGTAGNQYGQITLYSSGTNGHTIIPASGTSNANHTLPATTGTILNTGTTSFTQSLTSGTQIGTIKINGTETKIYAPTNTDEKATQTITETTNADYRVILSTNANDTTETNTLRKSAKFIANPATGAFYAVGYNRIDITGFTVDIDTYTLSSGSPQIKKYIVKTNGGSVNITNIPVAGYPFLLDVELIRWASTTDYVTRQTFVNNKDYSEYERYCISGTWGAWTKKSFTDENVKVTATNPSTGTWYYPVWYTNTSGTGGLNANDGLRYYSLQGTTSTNGQTILSIGNATANGTAGNKYGTVRIYGKGAYFTAITSNASVADNQLILPSTSGTLALNTVATTSANGLMSSTDKAKLDYTNVAYANCSTAAGTAAKVVTISGNSNWKLTQGSIVTVYYNTSNTASSVTLNVNDTGAKEIYYGTAKYTGNSTMICGAANRCITYMYSGAYWVWISSGMDNNTTYSNFVKSGTGAKAGLVPAPSTTAGTTKYLREDGTWQVPPDTDTHYTSHLYVGTSGGNANATTATSNPYLLCVDNTTNRNSVQLKAGSNMSVSAVNGIVTFAATNTTYSAATSSALGLVKVGSNITNTSGTISLTKANVTAALGYTPPTTNTTYSAMKGATSSAAGTAGLVPAPAAGKQTSFLRGDGTWVVPTNTDTKVTQTLINSSNTGNYPLLLAPTGQTATATTTANFASTLYYTPSNHTIVSKDLPLNFSSATTDISAANVSINGTASQVQLTGAKGVVLTSGDGGDIAINGTTHIEGKLTANNFITGTKTITLSSATAFGQANLTTTDLGFEPTASTTIVVSLRRSYNPAPAYFNVYAHFFKPSPKTAGQILLLISNGASNQTTVPAGTYYVDYIITNNT